MTWSIWNRNREITGLVEQYHPTLLAFLVGKTGDLPVSEDMAQEVWTRLLKADINKIENKRAYLFKMANHLLIDHYRKQATRNKAMQDQTRNGVALNGAVPRLEQEELEKSIRRILTETEYQLFQLENEGYGNEEIAAKMNLQPKTVANRRSMIKQKLKDHWNDKQ